MIDVAVIGAGISGIGAASYLTMKCPNKSFKIIESRKNIGGTWDLFKYPGIRSDSDMYTMGYSFKPWKEDKTLADGSSILRYLDETIDEYNLRDKISFNTKLTSLHWNTNDACWMLDLVTPEGEKQIKARFVFMGTGYYNYDKGYLPDFKGSDSYKGVKIHPQHWPEDLDYHDKTIAVIGSGATAATVVPAVAEKAKHVYMIQRSPTYYFPVPEVNAFGAFLKKILPHSLAYKIVRTRNVWLQQTLFKHSRKNPERVKSLLLDEVKKHLPEEYVDKHFTPTYNPWDQRICALPEGDLFNAINEKRASVITGHIDFFTETGIKMESGEEIQADIVVTATGLQMQFLGGADVKVDNREIDMPNTVAYKGMMYTGVPNLINSFGYINASWTLRSDLTCEFMCKLINYMDENNITHSLPDPDIKVSEDDWLNGFSSGYLMRSMHLFPKQGEKSPWRNNQNYFQDLFDIKFKKINDGALVLRS